MSVETTTRKTTQDMTISLVEYAFTFRALVGSPGDIKCIRTLDSTSVDTDMTRVSEIPSPSSATIPSLVSGVLPGSCSPLKWYLHPERDILPTIV